MNVTPYEEQMLITSNKKIIPVLVELKIGYASFPSTFFFYSLSSSVLLSLSMCQTFKRLAKQLFQKGAGDFGACAFQLSGGLRSFRVHVWYIFLFLSIFIRSSFLFFSLLLYYSTN